MKPNILNQCLTLAVIGVLWFLSVTTFSQEIGLRPGTPAPDFPLSTLVQPLPNNAKSLLDLRGNIIILEFWATWCAPCRKALRHLDTLSQQFASKNVRFIAISTEKRAAVEDFLKSKPHNLWTLIDSNGNISRAYKAYLIPHTVVIGLSGGILAVTDYQNVNHHTLEAILNGQQAEFEQRRSVREILHEETQKLAGLLPPYIRWRPCLSRDMSNSTIIISPEHHTLSAVADVRTLLQEAYQLLPFQIEDSSHGEITQDPYFIYIARQTGNLDALRDSLKMLLKDSLKVQLTVEKRKRLVYVLCRKRGIEGLPPLSTSTSTPYLTWQRTTFSAIRQPIRSLVRYLSTMYHVVDETGLAGEYDLSFSWDVTAKRGLEEGLATLGLEIVKTEREIDMYIVNHKNSSSQ